MLWTYLVVLSLMQGVTEFLPISSSANLILVRDAATALGLPVARGVPGEELALDVALHLGSLVAVLIHFRRDVLDVLFGIIEAVRGRDLVSAQLALLLATGTVPILIAGFLLKDIVAAMLRTPEIIALMTIVFGVVLAAADRVPERRREIGRIGFGDALIVGLAQCLALVPGVSRSGIAMTAARLLGLERRLSARFALLLSLPTVAGAGTLAIMDLQRAGDARLMIDAVVGGAMAFAASWAAIAIMMRWLPRVGFLPFAIYRVALGTAILLLMAL